MSPTKDAAVAKVTITAEAVEKMNDLAAFAGRLQTELDAVRAENEHLRAEAVRLRVALDRAGTRLVQVQPAIDPACYWALDIVPQAEREIAVALTEEER